MNTAKQNLPPTLPRETNAAIREVIKTVTTMNEMYEKETDALIAIDTPRFFELQNEKLTTASVYHAHISEMITRKDEIKMADPSLRAKLKELQTRLHALAENNLEALERMQRCTERLAQTIRNAAVRAAQAQRPTGYGVNGALNQSARNKVVSSGLSETA